MKQYSFKIKLTLLLVSSLTVMSGATIAPALPVMLEHFSHIGNAELWVRLVLTVPALFILSVAPLAGIFADRYGRKILLLPAMALYGFAGSSGLYLDSLGAILAGRALMGVAVAGVMTSVTTLIADYFDGRSRARFMGIQATFMGLGGVVFLTSGGLLAEIQWRLPFSIYLTSFALIPLAYFLLVEPPRIHTAAETKTGASHDVIRANATSSDKGRGRLLMLIYFTTFFTMVVFYLIPTQLPFYLEKLSGIPPSLSGIAIGTAILFSSMAALLYGRIRRRFGYITILGMSFALMGAGYLWLSASGSYPFILTGLAVSGLGMGLSMPNFTMWLTSEVPASIRGRAVGGLTTALFMGQFVSPLFSQPLIHTFGFGWTFQTAGLILLLLSPVFLFGERKILSLAIPGIENLPGEQATTATRRPKQFRSETYEKVVP
jgi:MFS family permease